jgi:Dullard-like phosphatase family protein
MPRATRLTRRRTHVSADEEAARQAAANSSASGHSGSLVNLHSPDGRAGVASPAARGYAAGVGVGAGSSPTSASVDNLRQRVAAVTVADAAGYAARGVRGSPIAATAAGTPPSGARAAATTAHNTAAIAAAQRQQAIAAAQAAAAAAAEEEEYEEFNPYLFIKMLPPYAIAAPRVPVIALPPKLRRMPEVNLVLDLDETLVHCSVDPIPDPDVTFPVTFNGAHYDVYVRKRPFLDRFFAAIAGKFEVTVFTASQQVYAEKLLNLLDPAGVHIHHRLYRDSCLNVEGNYLKDLNVLGRDLSKTVLVDNSPHAFGYQVRPPAPSPQPRPLAHDATSPFPLAAGQRHPHRVVVRGPQGQRAAQAGGLLAHARGRARRAAAGA